ncbi:hypothetical protein L3X38_031986 [Prunus dulcis]|uniref:Uncharacterized protein n=1 Tax=Prunus dulcis TaxID=3755 RepID=A0AAD4YVL5_PRUDU|nr:hypothetical protein L3X38_031986 [Prunus dulcis]
MAATTQAKSSSATSAADPKMDKSTVAGDACMSDMLKMNFLSSPSTCGELVDQIHVVNQASGAAKSMADHVNECGTCISPRRKKSMEVLKVLKRYVKGLEIALRSQSFGRGTHFPTKVGMGNPRYEYCEYEGGDGGKKLNRARAMTDVGRVSPRALSMGWLDYDLVGLASISLSDLVER